MREWWDFCLSKDFEIVPKLHYFLWGTHQTYAKENTGKRKSLTLLKSAGKSENDLTVPMKATSPVSPMNMADP